MQVPFESRRTLIARSCDSERPFDSSFSIPDALPLASADTDWREFRARLVASSSTTSSTGPTPTPNEPWAHPLVSPEPGCILLASPLFFLNSQTYFHRAVILLFLHGSNGSAGLILNRPTEYRLHEVPSSGLPQELNPCTVYLGGDVGANVVNVLHSIPGIVGAEEVLPGLFLGGVDGVTDALRQGLARPEDIKLLARYAGWGPGQLENEIRSGVWYVAAASKDIPLMPSLAGAGEGLWHAMMQLMGGEYAGLSAAVHDTLQTDVMGAAPQSDDSFESNEDGYSTDARLEPLKKPRPPRNLGDHHDYGSGI